MLPLLAALPLANCSDDAPETADALERINQHLRASLPQGEQQIQNLVYVSGSKTDEGYQVFVDYDLVSTMASVGLFNTISKAGDLQHVAGERFLFVKGAKGWEIQ